MGHEGHRTKFTELGEEAITIAQVKAMVTWTRFNCRGVGEFEILPW